MANSTLRNESKEERSEASLVMHLSQGECAGEVTLTRRFAMCVLRRGAVGSVVRRRHAMDRRVKRRDGQAPPVASAAQCRARQEKNRDEWFVRRFGDRRGTSRCERVRAVRRKVRADGLTGLRQPRTPRSGRNRRGASGRLSWRASLPARRRSHSLRRAQGRTRTYFSSR